MLKKMLVHGLIAAAVISTAAAVYAAGRGNGYAMENAASAGQAEADNRGAIDNGYITDGARRGDRDRYSFQGREHDRDHGRHRDHDEKSEHRLKYGERGDD